jgi:formiminoglutamase
VSAPQANGLFMQQVLPLLKIILQQKKLLSFDIVELSPSLDQDDATARLAANLVYEVLKQWQAHV